MSTILDTLKKGTEYLEKYGIEEARLGMEHLIAHVLKVERMQLYLDFDRSLGEKELAALRELTKRRSRGEPLQHLLGTIEFCDLEFITDSRALIPRPETEELASLLIDRYCKQETTGLRMIDVGCGSGVLGLSLAKHLDGIDRIVLTDVSQEAIALARENTGRLGLEGAVEIVESDLLGAIGENFDLIVSNLPYIPNREQTELSREVQRDPALALYGGETGTELIEQLIPQAHERLEAGGLLALEHGIDQAAGLRTIAEDHGFHPVQSLRDLSGVQRFLFAIKSS